MAINIDGIAVLRAITENPLAFPDLTTELNDVARKLVVKQFKAKATTIELLRRIHRAIGGEAFVLIFDDLGDTSIAALVKKLDKDNAELKTAPPIWFRNRLSDLASGAAALAEKAPKPVPVSKKEPKGKQPAPSPEQKTLAKELKAVKTRELAKARDLWREHGGASFTFVVGGLTEKQTQGLAKKLDKDNRDIATGSVEALRERIIDLASCRAEPVFKNILKSKAMAAT